MTETPSWLRGSWSQTFTGRQFYPLAPTVEDVDPIDIAHALSLTCRYGGHVDRFYSVAEHCVLMSWAVPPEWALWALLHDAAEAYVGDMVRPLKRQLPDYEAIELRVLAVVLKRFGVEVSDPLVLPPAVKDADNRILLTERAKLMLSTRHPWHPSIEELEPLDVEVTGWSPPFAEKNYLQRLTELLPDLMGGQ